MATKHDKQEGKDNAQGVSSFTLEIRGFTSVSRGLRALAGVGVLFALSLAFDLSPEDTLRLFGAYGAGAITSYKTENRGLTDGK